MIDEVYRDKLSQEVLLKYLKKGQIPTLEDVDKGTALIVRGRPLTRPLFDLPNALLQGKKERASAGKHNRTLDEVKRDLEVLYDAIFVIARNGGEIFDRTTTQMNGMLARIRELEGRMGSMLLVQKDSEGYFNFVFDNFQDLSKVDQTQTSAMVDLRSTMVHAQPHYRDAGHVANEVGELIIPEAIRQARARYLFASRASVVDAMILPQNPIENIWNPSDKAAVYRVRTKEAKPITMEFMLRLARNPSRNQKIQDPADEPPPPPEDWFDQFQASFLAGTDDKENLPAFSEDQFFYYISKVILDPHISNEGGKIVTSLQYLAGTAIGDNSIPPGGYSNWRNVPSDTYNREVEGKTAWNFRKIQCRSIRFIMTKMRPDRVNGDVFEYDFGIRHVSLFAQDYQISESAFVDTQLVSQALGAVDRNGVKVEFNKVSLEACGDIPQRTEIDYFVDFGIGGSFSGNWSQIDPINRDEPKNPTIALFDRVVEAPTLNLALDIIHPRGPTTTKNFRQWRSNHTRILNYTIDESTELTSEYEIWRNSLTLSGATVGRANNYSVRDTSDFPVETGWRFDGTYYSCYVYISEAQGRVLDFGADGVWINELFTRGVVTLSKGNHKIRTHRKNWHSLNGLGDVSAFDDVTNTFTGDRQTYGTDGLGAADAPALNVTEHDPLHPYNHKLLIEGLDYNAAFPERDKVYIGVARQAAILMEKVSIQDFANNVPDNDLTRWAQTSIIDDTNANARTVQPIMKTYLAQSTVEPIVTASQAIRETFVIVRKYKSGTLADQLKFRAVFKTNDPNVTPVLNAYIIKLAY